MADLQRANAALSDENARLRDANARLRRRLDDALRRRTYLAPRRPRMPLDLPDRGGYFWRSRP